MPDQALLTVSDTVLLTLPLVIMMLLGAFRLDQVVAAPRRSRRPRRAQCGVDALGRTILCDPDGRLSFSPGRVSCVEGKVYPPRETARR